MLRRVQLRTAVLWWRGAPTGRPTFNIFDPRDDTWRQAAEMNYIRYYPTVTARPRLHGAGERRLHPHIGPSLNLP